MKVQDGLLQLTVFCHSTSLLQACPNCRQNDMATAIHRRHKSSQS